MKNSKWKRLAACLVAIVLVATFTVTAFAGDGPAAEPAAEPAAGEGTQETGAPAGGAAADTAAVTADDLHRLYPSILVPQDNDLQENQFYAGEKYSTTLAGSVNLSGLNGGKILVGVEFHLKATGGLTFEAHTASNYTVEVYDEGTSAKFTYMQPISNNGARTFGSFNVLFSGDGSVANGAQGEIYIDKVVCGDAEVSAAAWEGSDNVLSASRTAVAGNAWSFGTVGAEATALGSVPRYEGDWNVQDFNVASGTGEKILFKLFSGNTAYPTSDVVPNPAKQYENLTAYQMKARVELTEGLLLPSDWTDLNLFATETPVYDGGNAADKYPVENFEKYFLFGGAGIENFNVYATKAVEDGKPVVYFRFVPRDGVDISHMANFNPTIEMPHVFFSDTVKDKTHTAKVSVSYVTGEDSYFSSLSDAEAKRAITAADGNAVTLSISEATNIGNEIGTSLNALRKTAMPWTYSISEAGANLGEGTPGSDGLVSRSYVSNHAITVKDGEGTVSQQMNRIWFYWPGIETIEVPARMDRMELSEVAKKSDDAGSFDPDEMFPIGFLAPFVGTADAPTADYEILIKMKGGAAEQVLVSVENGVMTSDENALAEAGFEVVDAYGYSGAVLSDEAIENGAYIESIRYVFKKVEGSNAASFKLTGTPGVLFMANKALDSDNDGDSLTNTSRLVVYKNTTEIAAEATQESTVPYRDVPDDIMTGGKKVQNTSKQNIRLVDGAPKSDEYNLSHSKGDELKYTITMQLDEKDEKGYVDGLWILDESENLDLPDDIKAAITISKANGSTMTYDGKAATSVSDEAIVYKDVAPTRCSWSASDADLTKYGMDETKTQMLFAFSGKLVKGDVITIEYTGKVGIAYDANSENTVKNNMKFVTFTKTGGGTGPVNPPSFEWKTTDDGSTEIKLGKPQIVSDVEVRLTNNVQDLSTMAFLPGEPYYLRVRGGLIASDLEVKDPAWLLYIPENLKLTGPAEFLALQEMTLALGADGNWNRPAADAANADEFKSKLKFTYFDVGGKPVSVTSDGYESVRYVRMDAPGFTLGKNQVAGYHVPVKTLPGSTGEAMQARAVFLGSQDCSSLLYRQFAGGWGWLDWVNWTAAPEEYKTDGFKNVMKAGAGSPSGNGHRYATHLKSITVHERNNLIDLTKSAAPAEVPLGESTTYTLTFFNMKQADINTELSKPTYKLDKIVDVLPAGQTIDGAPKIGTADLKCETDEVTIGGVKHQRITITVNKEVAYNASLKITYKATQNSLDAYGLSLENNDASRAKANNYASVYYNKADAKASDKDADMNDAGGKNPQWYGGETGENYNEEYNKVTGRIQASCELILKTGTITPGLEKTLVTKPDANGSFTGMPKLEWKIQAYNKGEKATGNAQIVDILPRGYVLDEGTTPTPNNTYTNNAGNMVVVWDVGSLQSSASDAVKSITVKAMVDPTRDISLVGNYTNMAYLLFEKANASFFTIDDIAKKGTTSLGEYIAPGDATLQERALDSEGNKPDFVYDWRGVYAVSPFKLVSEIGAGAEKTVTNKTTPANTAASGDPSPIEAMRGETVTYTYTMENNANSNALSELVMYDRLPSAEDDGYVILGNGRGSAWAPTMLEGTFSVSGKKAGGEELPPADFAGYEVYYSAKVADDISTWKSDSMDWVAAADWTGASPASFRIVFPANFTLKAGETLTVAWDMLVPEDLIRPLNNTASWNSAAYSMKAMGAPFVVEPEKVGVRLLSELEYPLTVSKVYNNASANPAEATFAFILEKWTGSAWLPHDLTHLPVTGITKTDGAPGEFTLAAAPNQTTQGVIEGLTEGRYRVREIGDLSGYTVDNNKSFTVNEQNTEGAVTITNTLIIPPPPPPEDPPPPEETDVPPGVPDAPPPVVPAFIPAPVVNVPAVDIQGGAPTGPGATQITPEQIPRGDLGTRVAWSLLNLMMATLAAFSSLMLFITLFRRKKNAVVERQAYQDENGNVAYRYVDENGDEAEAPERYRMAALKVPALILGFVPVILFLLLENVRLPMTWITQWTPLIGAFFIIHMVVMIIQVVLKKRQKQEEMDEDEGRGAPA